MAVYGFDIYGDSPYGWLETNFDAEPFLAMPQTYGQWTTVEKTQQYEDGTEVTFEERRRIGELLVSWNVPSGEYERLRLVRNTRGFSAHQDDGLVLFDELKESALSSIMDRGLKPGAFIYYTLWAYNEDFIPFGALGWRRAGDTIGIPLKDHGYRNRLWELLPDMYAEADRTMWKYTSQFPKDRDLAWEKGGPLQRFIGVIGEQLDHIRSEYESLFTLRDIDQMSAGMLPLLAHELGVRVEAELGSQLTRKLLKNSVYISQHKGTPMGVRALVSSAAGWDCDLLYDSMERKLDVLLLPDRLNLIPNPGFAVDLLGWEADPEETLISRSSEMSVFHDHAMKVEPAVGNTAGELTVWAPDEAGYPIAIYGLVRYGDERKTYAATQPEGGVQAELLPFRPKQVEFWHRYTFSCYINSNVSRKAFLTASFLDENKEFVASERSPGQWTEVLTDVQWDEDSTRHELTVFVPKTARYAGVAVEILGAEAGDEHWIDGLLLELSYESKPYFDGSFDPHQHYFWHGNAHSSPSYFYSRRLLRGQRLSALMHDHMPGDVNFELVFGEGAIAPLENPDFF